MLQFFGHQMYPWENLTMKKGATKIDQYWLPATFLQKKISWQTIGYKTNGFPIFFPIDQFFCFFQIFEFSG